MAATQTPTTDVPTLETTDDYEWPALDLDHDPQPLVDAREATTEETTLEDHAPVWATFPEPVDESDDDPETRTTTTALPLSLFTGDAADTICDLYADGHRLHEIASLGGYELERVARTLRREGVLEPHDDPRAIAHLYDRYGAVATVAREGIGGVCTETVRKRMEWYGIEREDNRPHYESLLAAAEGSA